MKKTIITMLLALVVLVSVLAVSCNIKPNEPRETDTVKETIAETVKETVAETETEKDTEPETEPETEHVHAFGEWTTTQEPTCTEKGVQTRTCACGETETSDVDALGHNEVENEGEAVEPTCFAGGVKAGTHCERCGLAMSEKAELRALGHEMDEEDPFLCVRCGTYELFRYDKLDEDTCALCSPFGYNDWQGVENNWTLMGLERKFVTIPRVSPEGRTVVELSGGAFAGCNGIEYIIVPDTVTKVCDVVFAAIPTLKAVFIPASVTEWGEYIFDVCDTDIYLEQAMTEMEIKRTYSDIFDGKGSGEIHTGCTLEDFMKVINGQ